MYNKLNNKVAFVIGHHENAKGFYSDVLEATEWEFWKAFAENNLTALGDVFIHNKKINSYTRRQKEMAWRTKDYDLVFELHFNSFDKDGSGVNDVEGVECFTYKGNKLTKQVGDYFCKEISNKLKYKNRGCKPISSGNGYGFLRETKGHAILLEPFFGDDTSDCMGFRPLEFINVVKDTIKLYYDRKD